MTLAPTIKPHVTPHTAVSPPAPPDRTVRAALLGIGCAAPARSLGRASWLELAETLAPPHVTPQVLRRIADGTRIDQRGCGIMGGDGAAPLYAPDDAGRGPGTAERLARWSLAARPLAAAAARAALAESGVRPEQITRVVTASCTGFEAPGTDQWLVHDLALSQTCSRTHVGFMGCHAAVNALAVADSFARADPSAVVLVVCVEVCSAHMHYGARVDRLIANALFADGAAAAVVSCNAPGDAPRIALTQSMLFPSTEKEMDWVVGNHGFEMSLGAAVPDHLRRHVGPWIRAFLARRGLAPQDVGGWAIHPGGPRVIEAILESLDLPPTAGDPARAILRQHGNMSSATVLFILRQLLETGARRPWVGLSFGPGLAGEALLLI